MLACELRVRDLRLVLGKVSWLRGDGGVLLGGLLCTYVFLMDHIVPCECLLHLLGVRRRCALPLLDCSSGGVVEDCRS